ncbi:MAG: AI-2E family transporter, partial [Rhodocyclaceae bacterium]|nr:AI-2E family transporter [Rhodocyclaceae bacterium]
MIERELEAQETGPLVWVAIITATCLALFLFQKILWLVVPFLLALILYYLLAPPVRWLVLRGWTVDAATGLVMSFLVATAVTGILLGFPWLASHMIDWQDSLSRYINGGLQLVDRTLLMLEANWSVLADAEIAAKVSTQLNYWSTNFADQQVESILMSAGSWLPILLLVPFITFFQLRDGRRFKDFISDAVPNAFFEKTLFLLNEVDRTTRAY